MADPEWVCGGELSCTRRFSPPENSALLGTPKNGSSKNSTAVVKLRPIYIELGCAGPGTRNLRSKTLLQMDPTFRLKIASKLDIWIKLGGMFSWVELDDKVSRENGTNLCYINTTSFFHAFNSYHVYIAWVHNYVLYQYDWSISKFFSFCKTTSSNSNNQERKNPN